MEDEIEIHCTCRLSKIDGIVRQKVPNYYTPWSKPWPEYNPPQYTSKNVIGKSYADPELNDSTFKPLWNNQCDGDLNRASYMGEYVVENGVPLNPIGRTGMRGRGVLGRWGPNHAADAIVTRWKPVPAAERLQNPEKRQSVLQFVSILRSDCKQWAIPGGFIEPGEDPLKASMREFLEEALNTEDPGVDSLQKEVFRKILLRCGIKLIHRGYVDDRRNTDNAWIESCVYNFHWDGTSGGDLFPLNAGSDATSARWIDISSSIILYANHSKFLEKVANHHNAKW